MPSNEAHHRGPTAPRGWRPGPLYILAAAFAIALILGWLFVFLPGTSTAVVDPATPPAAGPTPPAR